MTKYENQEDLAEFISVTAPVGQPVLRKSGKWTKEAACLPETQYLIMINHILLLIYTFKTGIRLKPNDGERGAETMPRQEVLNMLAGSDGYISGEKMSRMLNISRAAVWKSIKLLRREGYVISSKTNCGYKLEAVPDILDMEKIKASIKNGISELILADSVDSTNTALKKMAMDGAPEAAVFIADHQSAGRGRYGRSFISPKGRGIYMSILLRPERFDDLAGLTCMAAVAVCRTIDRLTEEKPEIKWTNDVLIGGKKLCGILTELSSEGESGEIRFVVIGIGLNVNHVKEDFPPELRDHVGSLYMAGAEAIDRSILAGELADNVLGMYRALRGNRAGFMDEYRRRCMTIGRKVEFARDNERLSGIAEGVEDDGALIVRLDGGEKLALRFGEVSIVV